MKHIAVVQSVYLPNSESNFSSEINQMQRYEPFVFYEKQKNIRAIPHNNVVVSPSRNKLEHLMYSQSFKMIYAQFLLSGIKMMKWKQKLGIPLITSVHVSDTLEFDKIKKKN